VFAVTSSSADFIPPDVSTYPLIIAAGASIALPIRFQPTTFGTFSATITVSSSDPAGPKHVQVSGSAPPGKLAVTGSTIFGAVPACCRVKRTIAICNVGNCKLHVSSVAFKRKSRHWKLVNIPFPAALHPGSCVGVVIRYIATDKLPRSCDLVITSDDPADPVRTLEVLRRRCGRIAARSAARIAIRDAVRSNTAIPVAAANAAVTAATRRTGRSEHAMGFMAPPQSRPQD
jgi:hypothetical protein